VGSDGLFRLRNGQPAPADERVRVSSGTLEGSNVNVTDAMVNLISLSRQFEMQMKMLQTADANAQAR
jgi:flagellar basal-body rod protein FlgF